MELYCETDDYKLRKQFREENNYYVELLERFTRYITLERYIEIYGIEGGTERFKNQKKYKNILKNTTELIGTIRYNYYTDIDINGVTFYPSTAVIKVPSNTKVFGSSTLYIKFDL